MRGSIAGRLTMLCAVGVFVAACGGSTSPAAAPLVLAVFAGNGQTAIVGQAVAITPAVRVTNSTGLPQFGITVAFAVATGNGVLDHATQTTDSAGVARLGSWTLSNVAKFDSLVASLVTATGTPIDAIPARFTATAIAGAAVLLTKVAGDSATGVTGTVTAARPSVRLTDTFGNPVSGVSVVFAISAGAGSVLGASQTTGADGIATVGGWTLGNVGSNRVTATATGTGIVGNPATFVAAATASLVALRAKGGE